jgi:hypothetical protein
MIMRRFDIERYKLTGEIEYLDEGVESMPTVVEVENAKKMREEIDTLEKFSAIGNTTQVANHCGVSAATAHGLKMSLRAKAEAMIGRATLASCESPETLTEGKEGVLGEFEEVSGNDCPKLHNDTPENANMDKQGETEIKRQTDYPEFYEQEETVDDLTELVEPEPSWSVGGVEDQIVEKGWNDLAEIISALRRIHMENAERDFRAKVMAKTWGVV